MKFWLFVLALWLAGLGFCLAHSWYPMHCCHDKDCHPIPCEEIEQLTGGAAKWNGYEFKADHVYPSQDSKCHACIYNNEFSNFKTPLCIFTQQNS